MKTVTYIGIISIICIIIFIIFSSIQYYKRSTRLTKISFHNWWTEKSEVTHSRVKAFFGNILEDYLDNYDEVRIYSIFGSEDTLPKKKDPTTLYIQYSGEAAMKDAELFDLSIVPSEEEGSVIAIPHLFLQTWCNQVNLNALTLKRSLSVPIEEKKFCLFAVSNGTSELRNRFFGELSNYKRVDSCGKFMNNLGYNCPGSHDSPEYCKFIGQYKFMICFENTSMTNYLTEKLLNSYTCGTIPIYWGCPNLPDYINMESILYLKSDCTPYDIQKLIIEIKRLDNDDELYKEKYEKPFFKDGKIPDNFQHSVIKRKIRAILN
jgi:hypothetical protein